MIKSLLLAWFVFLIFFSQITQSWINSIFITYLANQMEELLRSTNYPKQPAQHVCLLDAGTSETLGPKAPWSYQISEKIKSQVKSCSIRSKYISHLKVFGIDCENLKVFDCELRSSLSMSFILLRAFLQFLIWDKKKKSLILDKKTKILVLDNKTKKSYLG